MKKLTACFVCLFTFAGLASPAIAAPPGKANILHCGCVVDEEGNLAMAYINANVSNRARGHAKHGAGTIDSCFDGVDTFVDFQRTSGDCQIEGKLPGLPACEAEVDGGICGEQLPQ